MSPDALPRVLPALFLMAGLCSVNDVSAQSPERETPLTTPADKSQAASPEAGARDMPGPVPGPAPAGAADTPFLAGSAAHVPAPPPPGLVSPSGHAADLIGQPEPLQSWTGSQTVADLLRAETQAQRAPTPGTTPGRERGIRVQAIYGIGRQLMADVSINGDVQRFRTGQAQARRRDASVSDDAGEGYRLHRIEPPCVVLKQGTETLRTCLLGAADSGASR